MSFPPFLEARVINHDVPNHRVIVDIPSAQMFGIGAKLLVHGPADGVRVSHKALPGRGTWGLVAFPYGKAENGVWIGAMFPSLQTALTSNDDPFVEYNAHWSGNYEVMDGQGRWTKSFNDGTFIQISDQTTKPTMYRQTVDASQNQQLTEFTDDQRVTNKPSPRVITINHASGTTIAIDGSGNINVNVRQGSTVTYTTQTFVITGDLHVGGDIYGGFGSGDQIGLRTHIHPQGPDAHGDVERNTDKPIAGT